VKSSNHINFEVYAKRAKPLAEMYENMDPEVVHSSWSRYLPVEKGLALDIGAGSGRDTVWLQNKGFTVYSVEPVEEMRDQAQCFHPEINFMWIDDALPSLEKTGQLGIKFGLILVSAVWMHLTDSEQAVALGRLKKLSTENGLIVITIRNGPFPDERIVNFVDSELVSKKAKEINFIVIDKQESVDVSKRQGVTWETLVLKNQ
jgi:SAM-dependent methyltransferase